MFQHCSGNSAVAFIYYFCLVLVKQELFLEKFVEDAFDRMQDELDETILYPHLCTILHHHMI
jgi:hypothetical protein